MTGMGSASSVRKIASELLAMKARYRSSLARAFSIAKSRSAITACNSNTGKHAQREEGLQLVRAVEGPEARAWSRARRWRR